MEKLVNYVCQLDWDTESPDIWSTNILDISMRGFEFNIEINRLSKADCSPWVSLVQSVEEMSISKSWPSTWLRGSSYCLIDFTLWNGFFFFFLLLGILPNWNFDSYWILNLPAFGMEWHHKLSWFSGFEWYCPLALFGSCFSMSLSGEHKTNLGIENGFRGTEFWGEFYALVLVSLELTLSTGEHLQKPMPVASDLSCKFETLPLCSIMFGCQKIY